ncbi:hypothetical protein BKA56DRAFT_615981 [Ilyonectria sp. MPI-CAGE-AT-0026]|nr:hypothetical protein BKA56DRAFT_615981 [Ilyonectria sp. MPI-CAGE-AT-0026]
MPNRTDLGTPLLYNIPLEIALMIGKLCDVPTLRALTGVSKPCRNLFCRLAYEEVRIDSNQQVLDKLESFTSDQRSSAMVDVRDIIIRLLKSLELMVNLSHLSLDLLDLKFESEQQFLTLIKKVNCWPLHYFHILARREVTTLAIRNCCSFTLDHLNVDTSPGYLAAERYQYQITKLGLTTEISPLGAILERVAEGFARIEQLRICQVEVSDMTIIAGRRLHTNLVENIILAAQKLPTIKRLAFLLHRLPTARCIRRDIWEDGAWAFPTTVLCTEEQERRWCTNLTRRMGQAHPCLEQMVMTFQSSYVVLGARIDRAWTVRLDEAPHRGFGYSPEYAWAQPPATNSTVMTLKREFPTTTVPTFPDAWTLSNPAIYPCRDSNTQHPKTKDI